MQRNREFPVRLSVAAAVAAASLGLGATAAAEEADLAQKLANPLADLISVPLQLNADFGIGPNDGQRWTLNVQPVIPISLSEDWNLITRTIVPVIYQYDVVDDGGWSQFGLGDTLMSLFASPTAGGPGGVTWGAGPVVLIPTGTNDSLGSDQWGMGPTGVVLKQQGPWTYGVLANHVWGFGGGDREINATFLQPFLAYTTPSATTFTLNTESTYDWAASQWTVPINAVVSQLVVLGGQPMSFAIGGRYYAEKPEGGPEWGLRFAVTLLFPR
jgi:hypothetical protein